MAAPAPKIPLVFTSTDQFMASQILAMAAPGFRYCRDSGAWLWKGGQAWEVFPGDAADTIIARVVEKLPKGTKAPKGTAAEDMTEEQREYEVHARLSNSQSASGIARKMRAVAPGSPLASTAQRDLDTDGSVIWAGGVPWNLRASAGGLVVADRAAGDVHLKCAGYAPAAGPAPLWDGLLEAAFPDKEIRQWAEWELCGACTASGGKALVHLVGVRDTAKTTILRCCADLLGSYAVQIPRALLTGQQAHEGTVLRLAGARLAWFDEKPRRGQVAQEFLKDMTGGGRYQARPPYGRGVIDGRFAATVVMASNDELPLTDAALLGRVRRVPMTGDPVITRAARNAILGPDGMFTAAWKAEAPAVLARLILMCSARMNGWTVEMPASAAAGLMDAAAEQDSAGAYIAEELTAASTEFGSTAGELHGYYVTWCRNHNITGTDITGLRPFGKRLTAEFGEAARTRRGSVYPVRVRQP